MTLAVISETKKLEAALTGRGALDTKGLEAIFEKCRYDKDKMLNLVRAFCGAYLVDGKLRPLKLRPLQEEIIVMSLLHPSSGKQRKMAILAPRGCGKSFALSVSVVIYMFFKRFRDLVFILAPSEDQAALIFNYVYRHFSDNRFLDSLVDNYKFHNKPHIRMKGGTLMRRAPLAPSNQGQSIRGQHPTFCIVDESPLIDDHLFVDNVEPAIVSNKAPFINLGTPKSKDNHMWRYLYDDAYSDSFERLVFTWREAIDKGEAYEAPYDEEEMLTKMMEWGEDSIYWRTEYECEFVESVSNVFNPEKLKACFDAYEPYTPETLEQGRGSYPQVVVGVDIGKSINSTVITGWGVEKFDGPDGGGNLARLIYLEEINPRTGGHDIPYQRKRIMDVARTLCADRLIIDATGIGGAIEQDLRVACINSTPQIHFLPFVFTGGPKGTKTQAYRDYQSFVQQGLIKVPDPDQLEGPAKKLTTKWFREHCDLQYVMDAANKTERISAPDGRHDDYCDSCVMGIHAALTMLPGSASFGSAQISKDSPRTTSHIGIGQYTNRRLFTTQGHRKMPRKYKL